MAAPPEIVGEVLSRVRPSSRAGWPSPAELPSELRRVSEPARSEDLEDFNRKKSFGFPEDFELGRSWAELSGAQRSSAEPEPSSAEHFPIAHFWTQPAGANSIPEGGPPILGPLFFQSLHKVPKTRDRCSDPEV